MRCRLPDAKPSPSPTLPACALAAVLAATLLASGCKSAGDESRKPAELTDFKSTLAVRTVWRVDVGSGRGASLQPAVVENAVYAAAADGNLLRLASDTGRTVWRVEVGSKISAGVGSDGFTVVVATPRGEVLAYDSDGKPRWRAQLSSDVIAPPLVGRGLVIVRSTDHRVTAFEADTGKRRWVFQRQPPPLTVRAPAEMVFAGDNVVVGLPAGRLVAIALSNGGARWEALVAEPKGTTEVERLSDVIGAIAADGREICAAAFQGRLMCADTASGALRWSRELSAGGGVAMDAQHIFAVDGGSQIWTYTRDGASVWRNDKLARRGLSAPLALRSAIAVGDAAGYVHFLSLTDGAFAARISLGGGPITAPPRPLAGGAVVQAQDGQLALLAVER